MSATEVEEKFQTLADPVIGAEKARAVIRQVQSLGKSDSLEALLSGLRKP